jgi:hypothetical protein
MFKFLKTDLLFILYQVTNKKPLNSENKLKKLQQLNYYLFFKLKNNAKNRSLNLRLADSRLILQPPTQSIPENHFKYLKSLRKRLTQPFTVFLN